jgi:hypothetical protein
MRFLAAVEGFKTKEEIFFCSLVWGAGLRETKIEDIWNLSKFLKISNYTLQPV